MLVDFRNTLTRRVHHIKMGYLRKSFRSRIPMLASVNRPVAKAILASLLITASLGRQSNFDFVKITNPNIDYRWVPSNQKVDARKLEGRSGYIIGDEGYKLFSKRLYYIWITDNGIGDKIGDMRDQIIFGARYGDEKDRDFKIITEAKQVLALKDKEGKAALEKVRKYLTDDGASLVFMDTLEKSGGYTAYKKSRKSGTAGLGAPQPPAGGQQMQNGAPQGQPGQHQHQQGQPGQLQQGQPGQHEQGQPGQLQQGTNGNLQGFQTGQSDGSGNHLSSHGTGSPPRRRQKGRVGTNRGPDGDCPSWITKYTGTYGTNAWNFLHDKGVENKILKYLVLALPIIVLALPAVYFGVDYFTKSSKGNGDDKSRNRNKDDKPQTFIQKTKDKFQNLSTPKKLIGGAVVLGGGYALYNQFGPGSTIQGSSGGAKDRGTKGGSLGDASGSTGDKAKSFFQKNGGWLVPLLIFLVGGAIVMSQLGDNPTDDGYYDGDLEAGGDAGW